MTYFPDAERALTELARAVHSDVVARLPLDFASRAEADGIVEVTSTPSPGSPVPWERIDHVNITVYAPGLTAAKALANDIRAVLDGTRATSFGLLDDVFVVTEPYELPYPSDVAVQITATYGVVSRVQDEPADD